MRKFSELITKESFQCGLNFAFVSLELGSTTLNRDHGERPSANTIVPIAMKTDPTMISNSNYSLLGHAWRVLIRAIPPAAPPDSAEFMT